MIEKVYCVHLHAEVDIFSGYDTNNIPFAYVMKLLLRLLIYTYITTRILLLMYRSLSHA